VTKPLSSPMLQARDIIYDSLLVREGALITPMVARERANNIAMALIELLEPRGTVVSGTIEPGAVPRAEVEETTEEMAERLIK
jgi:hypothetical protein